MKRITCIGTLALLALLMIASMAVAQPYDSTDRVLITVKSGNIQYQYGISGALNYDLNTTLPVAIGDFNQTMTKIVWTFTGFVNMTGGYWNERVYGPGAYHNGQIITETLYMSIHQGGGNDMDANDTWSHLNWTMDSTAWTATVYYYYDDVEGLNDLITVTETDETTPNVGEHWTVNDTLTVGTLPFAMDTELLLKYPKTAIKDDDFWWNATVTTGSKLSVIYQKYGPAQDPDDITVTGNAGDVSVAFDSKDKMKDANWLITFADDQWNGKLANIDANSLVVKMNGDTVDEDDYTLTTNSLDITECLDVDNDDNELTLTWTVSTGEITPTETPTGEQPVWYMQTVGGFPMLLVIGVIAVIVIVLVVASKGKK